MVKSDLPNEWRGRIIRYAPLFLWICVVLFASTTQGAMQNTSRIIRPLLEFLFPNTPEETINIYHGFVRKLAHLSEYAILAFWAFRAFSTSSIKIIQKFWFIFSLIAVFLVACIDEYNQSFNILRTGSGYDVLLDACGGLLMILLLLCYKFIRKSTNHTEFTN